MPPPSLIRKLGAGRDRQPKQFRYVFVVTYGRSGSTLVQGLLNTLPRTLVRGENNFYILPLFRASGLVRAFRAKHGRNTEASSSAFYGLNEIRLDDFAQSAHDLVVGQLLGSVDPGDFDVLGFKEVLWHRVTPRETERFFDYFEQVFPGAKYVLNQRQHASVIDSGFWQSQTEDEVRQAITRVEEIQEFLRRTRPERSYDTRYEVLTGEDEAAADRQLIGLAEFVAGSCDQALLAALRETMTTGHGPNPFGASRGRRRAVRERS